MSDLYEARKRWREAAKEKREEKIWLARQLKGIVDDQQSTRDEKMHALDQLIKLRHGKSMRKVSGTGKAAMKKKMAGVPIAPVVTSSLSDRLAAFDGKSNGGLNGHQNEETSS